MNLPDHPWMQHNVTGHRAQLPDLPYWRANGWEPCDGPPPEPDLTRDTPLKEPQAPTGAPPSEGLLAVQPAADKKE